jgi:hypothetical protein
MVRMALARARERSVRQLGTTTERGEASRVAQHSSKTGVEPTAKGKMGGGSRASGGWLDASQTGVAVVGPNDDKGVKAHVRYPATSSTACSPIRGESQPTERLIGRPHVTEVSGI